MNLKTHISQQLWLAISNTYESENYSHAILDAAHYLSDVLREKTGVDGDGQSLVGKALGGQAPILRINKLQTESERNTQKGLEQILSLYFAPSIENMKQEVSFCTFNQQAKQKETSCEQNINKEISHYQTRNALDGH